MPTTVEVVCAAGQRYDYSILEKNDIIDCLFSELVIQKPYVITDFEYKEKYDYETDKFNTVTIITLNSDDVIIRVAAPYALIEHMGMIADRTPPDAEYTIIRTSEYTVKFSFDRWMYFVRELFHMFHML